MINKNVKKMKMHRDRIKLRQNDSARLKQLPPVSGANCSIKMIIACDEIGG